VKIDQAINDVRDAETELAKRLRLTGERHAVEHDLYHLGHTLARQCADHLDQLATVSGKYGVQAEEASVDESPGLLETARHKASEVLGRSETAGLLLLRDLREVYLRAQAAEIAWIILIQAAKAGRDTDLLTIATSCHTETETCGKWLRTRIKETSPQVLATG
jgi:hypothetical protein